MIIAPAIPPYAILRAESANVDGANKKPQTARNTQSRVVIATNIMWKARNDIS